MGLGDDIDAKVDEDILTLGVLHFHWLSTGCVASSGILLPVPCVLTPPPTPPLGENRESVPVLKPGLSIRD